MGLNNPAIAVTHTLWAIPGGPEGTIATLRIMSALVKHGKLLAPIRARALEVTRRARNYGNQVELLHGWVRDNMRYISDPTETEALHTADVLLSRMSGDCDDHAILLSSLLESIGHVTRFKAVGFSRGIFEHVYTESRIGARWWALETTQPVPMGWNPPGVVSRLYHSNSNS